MAENSRDPIRTDDEELERDLNRHRGDEQRRARAEAIERLQDRGVTVSKSAPVEAVVSEVRKIQHPEVRVNVIHQGVGGITESDIMLASASNALVVGFNVRPNAEARALAEREGVLKMWVDTSYDNEPARRTYEAAGGTAVDEPEPESLRAEPASRIPLGSSPFATASWATLVPARAAIAVSVSPGCTT